MYKTSTFLISVLFMFLTVSVVWAETIVEGDELKNAFSGKTLEGTMPKWGSNHRTYLDPSGTLKRAFGKKGSFNNTEQGSWRIGSDGRFCLDIQKERCRTVKRRDDGGYNFYNRWDEVVLTIDNILDGNPYNL